MRQAGRNRYVYSDITNAEQSAARYKSLSIERPEVHDGRVPMFELSHGEGQLPSSHVILGQERPRFLLHLAILCSDYKTGLVSFR